MDAAFTVNAPPPPTDDQDCSDSAELFRSYPLTHQELRVLATYWWELYLDCDTRCVLLGAALGNDGLVATYAKNRLDDAEAVLGFSAINEVAERVRCSMEAKLGPEAWTTYRSKEPVWHATGDRDEIAYAAEGRDGEQRANGA